MPSAPTSYQQDEPQNYIYEPNQEQDQSIDSSTELYYGTVELLDALPKIWTRGMLYVLIGFFVAGVPWAIFSKVDETKSAKGRLEPKGETQKIDSQASGKVISVLRKEGDRIKSGQVLLRIESTLLQPQLKQVQSKLQAEQEHLSQLKLLKEQMLYSTSLLIQQNKSQELEKAAQVNQAQQNLEAKLSTYNLQKVQNQTLVSQAQEQIAANRDDQKLTKSRWDIDSNLVQRYSKLVQDGAVSLTQVDQLKKAEQESRQIYDKAESDIKQAKLRLVEENNRYQVSIALLGHDIKQAKLQLQEQQNSYKSLVKAGNLAVLKNQEQLKDLQNQITGVESDITQFLSEISSIRLQVQQRIVRSPIDGVIYEFPINKPGVVVQTGQRIAQIAPKNVGLVLSAEIPSQDSGFLKLGMSVKVKFDAYPFQEYGIVPGKITWISPDSKITQTPAGNIGTYELEITLAHQYIQNGNKRIPLTPGQTANAEVVVRQRRIIDFVLEPFKKLQKNGLEP